MPISQSLQARPDAIRAGQIVVEVEDEPTPLVAITAASLRRLLTGPAFVQRAGELSGVAVIRALTGPQSVTIRIGACSISLRHGVAPDAEVSVGIDLNGGSAQPEIAGGDQNPKLAEWLMELLKPPSVDWRDAAEQFWRVASVRPGAPAGLLVCELDRGERLSLGDVSDHPYEIHGRAESLSTVLLGQLPLAEAAARGIVFVRGSVYQLSVLTGASFAMMLGESR